MFSYTHRKHIAAQELDDLPKRAHKFMVQVENELSNLRELSRGSGGSECKLYLTQINQYRLLTLKVWMERYRVDLAYIIGLLVPFWEKFIGKRSKAIRKSGLNVRVTTLVGKKSESILKESLAGKVQDDAKRIFISFERERLYAEAQSRVKHTFPRKIIKSILEYDSPVEYARAYMIKMRQESVSRNKIASEFRKRPYRGNPFREETV